MIKLFDQEEILERYVADERHKAELKNSRLIAKKLLSDPTLSLEFIAECTGLPLDEIEELAKEVWK